MEKIVNHTGKTTLFSPVVTYKKLVPDFGIVPLYQKKNAVITPLSMFLDKNGLVFFRIIRENSSIIRHKPETHLF